MAGSVTIASVFIEVIGRRPLPDDVDRDDVVDLLADVLGTSGEVTGAGTGSGGWHLDVEIAADMAQALQMLKRLAVALAGADLGWVLLRPETDDAGKPARELI